MPVSVERRLDRDVSESRLNRLGMLALLDEMSSVTVTQIMEPKIVRHVVELHDCGLPDSLHKVPIPERLTLWASEQERIRVALVDVLADMTSKQEDDLLRELHWLSISVELTEDEKTRQRALFEGADDVPAPSNKWVTSP